MPWRVLLTSRWGNPLSVPADGHRHGQIWKLKNPPARLSPQGNARQAPWIPVDPLLRALFCSASPKKLHLDDAARCDQTGSSKRRQCTNTLSSMRQLRQTVGRTATLLRSLAGEPLAIRPVKAAFVNEWQQHWLTG